MAAPRPRFSPADARPRPALRHITISHYESRFQFLASGVESGTVASHHRLDHEIEGTRSKPVPSGGREGCGGNSVDWVDLEPDIHSVRRPPSGNDRRNRTGIPGKPVDLLTAADLADYTS